MLRMRGGVCQESIYTSSIHKPGFVVNVCVEVVCRQQAR
jgi:hypothetical protein